LSVGKEKLFWFFSVGFCVGKKPNVLFVRLAFAVQIFNFSTIFALLTTFMYMESCVFVCEDFPKENRMQANKATHIGLV